LNAKTFPPCCRRRRPKPKPRKQFLLDDVLQATRREGRGAVLLIFGQLLAKPGHRPVEVMQVEVLDPIDPVILPPAVRRSIGAARK
jgi:hypothetical protein